MTKSTLPFTLASAEPPVLTILRKLHLIEMSHATVMYIIYLIEFCGEVVWKSDLNVNAYYS